MSENATLVPMRQRVAEEIRVLLARRRMSASELARKIGASQPYVSRRLTGETAFDVDDLEMIAVVLEVQPSALLGGGAVDTVRYPRPRPKQQVKKPRDRPAGTGDDDRPPSRRDSRRPTLLHRRAKR